MLVFVFEHLLLFIIFIVGGSIRTMRMMFDLEGINRIVLIDLAFS